MKTFVVFMTASLLSASAFAGTTLSCKATGFKTEVDQADLNDGQSYPDLKKVSLTKTVQIEVGDKSLTLQMFDGNGQAITVPVYNHQTNQYDQISNIPMQANQRTSYTKRGEVGYSDDQASVLDDSFGSYFDFVTSAVEWQGSGKVVHARLWWAELSEPDDDTGNQSLYNNSNLYLTCIRK